MPPLPPPINHAVLQLGVNTSGRTLPLMDPYVCVADFVLAGQPGLSRHQIIDNKARHPPAGSGYTLSSRWEWIHRLAQQTYFLLISPC